MLLIFSLNAPACLDIYLAAFSVFSLVVLATDSMQVIHLGVLPSYLSEKVSYSSVFLDQCLQL